MLQPILRFWRALSALAAPTPSKPRRRISNALIARISAEVEQARPTYDGPVVPPAPPANVFAPMERPQWVPQMAMDDAGARAITVVEAWATGNTPVQQGIGFLGYPFLAEIAQRAEYRRISEIIAKEMTRKWVKLGYSGADTKASAKLPLIEAEMKRLQVKATFRRAAELDGQFGRSHIYIDLGKLSADEMKMSLGAGGQVTMVKVKKGALRAVKVLEPLWVYPASYNSTDPLADDYYKPETWYVQAQEVHATRVIPIVGREVSDMLKPAYAFGGLSLSQMAMPYINNWLRARQSVSDLLHSFTVFELATDLDQLLAAAQDPEAAGADIIQRIELFARTRDNRGIFLRDKESEEFGNVSASLSSIDKLLAQAQEQLATVAGIPLVKLLGTTPSGLNASTDNELRCFYDWILAQQEAMFSDPLKVILVCIQMSLFGEVDSGITFEWEPLWTLNDTELATKRKTDADTDVALIDAGVIDPQESRERVARDPNTPYKSLDLTKVIEPPAPPEESDGFGGESSPPGDGEDSPVGFDRAPFVESEHPRADDGEFTTKTGGISITRDPQSGEWSGGMHGRAKALGIPPAWTNVRINPDPNGKLQALGTDSKGRVQPIYSKAWRSAQDVAKFQRLKLLDKVVPQMRDVSRQHMLDEEQPPIVRDSAAVTYLISKTGFRIGGEKDTGADVQAYGASTLLGSQVKVKGSKIMFDFTGKKGVHQDHVIDDRELAAYIKSKHAKPSQKIFGGASTQAVRNFFHAVAGDAFKVKDLRTWKATTIAMDEISKVNPHTIQSMTDFKKLRNQVGDRVAEALGNTRAMALGAYIDPTVFAMWEHEAALAKAKAA